MSWPPPVEIYTPNGTSDIVLLCEHASNHIPAEYHSLGLQPSDLQRHIAWDPGAAELTRRLSKRLDAPAFLGSCSRLLIDLNRPLDAPDSIVTRSETTDIPGNMGLAPEERIRRVQTIFQPFHLAVTEYLDLRSRSGQPTRLVSLHSFTPAFHGVTRPWHGGVLFEQAEEFGLDLVRRLNQPGSLVGANVPYKTSRTEDYAVPIHGDDRGIPAVLIEIRNDQIATKAGMDAWADRLSTALLAF